MIFSRFQAINVEKRKLVLSLAANFATRIPGAIGVLWFLPLLRFGLGTEDYANLLASGALAAATTFLIGGFSIVGRRLIGEAYSNHDHTGEANAFVSLITANLAALALADVLIVAYCYLNASSKIVLVISLIPAFGLFLTTFDNARSAYNEHYVTATLQLIFQMIIYTIGFLVAATQHNLFWAAMILQGHTLLASMITLGLLLRARPYLLRGVPNTAWRIMHEGLMLALADGFLMTTLSLAVIWLQATSTSEISAWFATTVRLFSTFLVPVILLLLPLSSYIRLLWNSKTVGQQRAFARMTLWLGVGYGSLVSLALLIATRLYVGELLHLPAPSGFWEVLPTFVLFGAVVAWKSYSSIAYVVLEGTTHLSFWTTIVIGISMLISIVSDFAVDPLGVVNIYAFVAGLSIFAVLFWNNARSSRLMLVSISTISLIFLSLSTQLRAQENTAVPSGYKQVWVDNFTSLSLRTGGWTYDGLEMGSGVWGAPGAWYTSDPRGIQGFGYEWFIDPSSYNHWPSDYPETGEFKITPDGLRIRCEVASKSMSMRLPRLKNLGGVVPWMCGEINSFHGVRIRPPFYFEVRAKMPYAGDRKPWPALWLGTGMHRPGSDFGKEYEIDLHEGFGDDDKLHATIHWNPSATTKDYPSKTVVDAIPANVNLSADFNTWGVFVTKDQQIFYFNSKEVGRTETPSAANADQPFNIILNVSAGLPWRGGGPPKDGPFDMIVRYIKLYATDRSGLILHNIEH